jgi:hypothetical protein
MANTGLKTYSADEIVAVFGNIIMNEGLADGTFITVEWDEDAYALSVGADGEATRSKTNNRAATITLTLMQTSDVNDLLSTQYLLDINSPGGAGVAPFLLKDTQGRTLMAAEQCWIQRAANVEYGREATTREWVLRTSSLVPFIGGN